MEKFTIYVHQFILEVYNQTQLTIFSTEQQKVNEISAHGNFIDNFFRKSTGVYKNIDLKICYITMFFQNTDRINASWLEYSLI